MSETMPISYRSPKTLVRPSPIHGRGLFEKTAIAKDERRGQRQESYAGYFSAYLLEKIRRLRET